jgi:hypothetical protein
VIARALAKYMVDLVTFPGDAVVGYRNDGLRGVWETVAPRTVHRIVRRSRLTVFSQPLDTIPDLKVPAGVTVAPLRPEQVPALAPVVGERDRERFRQLLDVGCIGLVAWRGERPVGYAWVAREMRPEALSSFLPMPRISGTSMSSPPSAGPEWAPHWRASDSRRPARWA